MPISFPHRDDVTLEAPPLTQVICQVRFAPILQIVVGLPSAYQELIRLRFPKFGPGIKDGGRSLVLPFPPNEFFFETYDGQSKASLALDFIALFTQKYSHWQSFTEDLQMVLGAFEEVYGSILTTRIGLRYINELRFANTGTDSMNGLVDLLNPELTHLYRNPIWSPPEKITDSILLHDDSGSLALRIEIASTPEARISLDYDFYTELVKPVEMGKDKILETVSSFHQVIYNAFRWSIREEGMRAFQAK